MEKGIVVSAEVTDDGKFLPSGAGVTKANRQSRSAAASPQPRLVGEASAYCDLRDVETRVRVSSERQRFDPRHADERERALQLRGMAQYPLLLGFLCALYQKERTTQSDRLRYFADLRRLLSGRWHDTPRSVSDAEGAAKLELLR